MVASFDGSVPSSQGAWEAPRGSGDVAFRRASFVFVMERTPPPVLAPACRQVWSILACVAGEPPSCYRRPWLTQDPPLNGKCCYTAGGTSIRVRLSALATRPGSVGWLGTQSRYKDSRDPTRQDRTRCEAQHDTDSYSYTHIARFSPSLFLITAPQPALCLRTSQESFSTWVPPTPTAEDTSRPSLASPTTTMVRPLGASIPGS